MEPYQRKTRDIIPFILLALMVVVFFGEVLHSGKSLFGSDFVLQFYPWKQFIYDRIRSHGAIPFWNPYIFSGTPFITNIQASMFYPPGILYYLIPPEAAYLYSTILHCLLGAIFMYLFMRTISVSPAGAFLSASVFTFNGYFMAHLYAGHLSFVQNYVWIPLIFCFLYLFLQKTHLPWALAGGLTLGIQILGGFPQIAFYTILGILTFTLFNVIRFLKKGLLKESSKAILGMAVVLFTGFAVAAVQILPTLEFVGLSTRSGGVDFPFATYDSIHPKELLSFFIPELFGNATDRTYWRSQEASHFWETCGYVGILPLFLAFVRPGDRPHRGLRLFFLILMALSIFLALGKHNPMYALIYHLPGFHSFRIPAQIIFLYIFGVAVVGGIGLHGLIQGEGCWQRGTVGFFLMGGTFLLFLLFGLSFFPSQSLSYLLKNFSEGAPSLLNPVAAYDKITLSVERVTLLLFASFFLFLLSRGRRPPSGAFSILSLGVVILDLYLFGAQFIRPYEFVTPPVKKEMVAPLKGYPSEGRVLTESDLYLPNDGLQYGFSSISGYDPLILRDYAHFFQKGQGIEPEDHVVYLRWMGRLDSRFLRLLNVRSCVQGGKVRHCGDKDAYVHLVPKAVIKPDAEVLPFMMSEGFDLRRMVVFKEGDGYEALSFGGADIQGFSYSILRYENETIRLKVSAPEKGYLVLSEIFYPGWRARVDGQDVSILRGNAVFRVIPMEKGEHEVSLRFVSTPFRAGVILSLLTLAICLGVILYYRGRQ